MMKKMINGEEEEKKHYGKSRLVVLYKQDIIKYTIDICLSGRLYIFDLLMCRMCSVSVGKCVGV